MIFKPAAGHTKHLRCIRVLLLVSNDLVIGFCGRRLHRRPFRRQTAPSSGVAASLAAPPPPPAAPALPNWPAFPARPTRDQPVANSSTGASLTTCQTRSPSQTGSIDPALCVMPRHKLIPPADAAKVAADIVSRFPQAKHMTDADRLRLTNHLSRFLSRCAVVHPPAQPQDQDGQPAP